MSIHSVGSVMMVGSSGCGLPNFIIVESLGLAWSQSGRKEEGTLIGMKKEVVASDPFFIFRRSAVHYFLAGSIF